MTRCAKERAHGWNTKLTEGKFLSETIYSSSRASTADDVLSVAFWFGTVPVMGLPKNQIMSLFSRKTPRTVY